MFGEPTLGSFNYGELCSAIKTQLVHSRRDCRTGRVNYASQISAAKRKLQLLRLIMAAQSSVCSCGSDEQRFASRFGRRSSYPILWTHEWLGVCTKRLNDIRVPVIRRGQTGA